MRSSSTNHATRADHDHWQHFAHDADIGVRGIAASLSGAFEQAALAMTAAITDPETVAEQQQVDVVCEAPDMELLLVDWLNAIVYEMAIRKMLFGRFKVVVDDGRLRGSAWGEPIDLERHTPVVEVKGATLTSLRVEQRPDGLWLAQCVVDV